MKKTISKNAVIILSILIFAVAGSIILGHKALAQQALTKIADDVYSYVDVKNSSPANSFGANAGIIIGKDGIVVIDTLVSSKEAKRFIKDIRAVSDKPIKYVINTHYHLDHTFGNSEFVKLGATVVSHKICKNNLKDRGEGALQNSKDYGLTEEDMEGTEIVYPVLNFQDRMEIDAGNQEKS